MRLLIIVYNCSVQYSTEQLLLLLSEHLYIATSHYIALSLWNL